MLIKQKLHEIVLPLAVAAFVSLVLAGCRSERLLVDSKTGNDSEIPPDTLISISLTDTLDQWFTLDISASGEIVYTPTKYNGYNRTNLPPQGVPVKGQISREELTEIIREFEKQKFFSLKDAYDIETRDCPDRVFDAGLRTISIRIGGRHKTVRWKACFEDGKEKPAEFFAVFGKINAARYRKN